MYTMYVLCTYIQNENYVIAIYALRVVLTSVLQESQGLTINAFVMLLLAMISLHMLPRGHTFRDLCISASGVNTTQRP